MKMKEIFHDGKSRKVQQKIYFFNYMRYQSMYNNSTSFQINSYNIDFILNWIHNWF